MLLSTSCRIIFTFCTWMFWNCLEESALFISRVVYFFLFLYFWYGGVLIVYQDVRVIIFWEGVSYFGRRDQPGSSWMLAAVGYEQQIYPHMECFRSLDGVFPPIRVTECWLPPLVYTRQDLSIQGGRQFCWYGLLLYCSGHIDIFHQALIFIKYGFWCRIQDGIYHTH